jgi:hypothetical protein
MMHNSLWKNLLYAAVVSVLIALPISFLSMTFAKGNYLETFRFPQFWALYLGVFAWYFAAGFLSSAIVLVLAAKPDKREKN